MSARLSTFEPVVQRWAQPQWGTVDLGDRRRNRRAVVIGARLAAAPDKHLPQQMADRAQLVATYRLLDNAAVSHPTLSEPHWQGTRQQAGHYPLVLLVQDVTTLEYTHYAETMTGLGPIGNGGGRGLLMHTTLALVPSSQQVLGLAHQQVFVRRPNPRPTQKRRPKAERESRVWVVRVWGVEPPEGAEALEWVLTTSVAVETPEAALERVAWYRLRWLVEDYHQCLKTGCQVEHRDFEDAARITRLMGFLAIIAVRLLQLRQAARLTPEASALEVVEPLLVQLLAARLKLDGPSLTLRAFWRGVAQLGGFVGRRRDGEPGWKTLWRGWLYLDTLAQGVRLAATFPGS